VAEGVNGDREGIATGLNSRYFFALTRKNATATWKLREVHAWGPNGPTPEYHKRVTDTSLLYEPIRVNSMRLADLLGKPTFKILRVVARTPDQVEVEFEVRHPATGTGQRFNPVQSGRLTFMKDQYWVLRSYSVKLTYTNATAEESVVYTYATLPSGLPVPTRMTNETRTRPSTGGEPKVSTTEKMYELSEPDPSGDESPCTLTAYGLPEPVGLPAARTGRGLSYLLAAAAVFGILAVLFTRLARGRKGTP
jgi:hypothetical protein